MKKQIPNLLIGLIILALLSAPGCSSNSLPLQKSFAEIKTAQTNSTEVMNMLPDQGLLVTDSAVSAFHKKGWTKELGIVRFAETDASVQRKEYMQIRSQLAAIPLFVDEKLILQVQSVIPADILNQPYENDLRKHEAVLRYCHQALQDDGRAFSYDQQTESLIGLARTVLGVGIQQFAARPRESEQILDPKGFPYEHPTVGKCRLNLFQQDNGVYTVIIRGGKWNDPITTW